MAWPSVGILLRFLFRHGLLVGAGRLFIRFPAGRIVERAGCNRRGLLRRVGLPQMRDLRETVHRQAKFRDRPASVLIVEFDDDVIVTDLLDLVAHLEFEFVVVVGRDDKTPSIGVELYHLTDLEGRKDSVYVFRAGVLRQKL